MISIEEVRNLIQDVEKAETRLDSSKMKEKVLFHCTTKRYLRALKKEWEKAEKTKADAKKVAGKSKKKAGKLKDKDGENDKEAEASEETKLQPGHLPVTDWRVFDQRFLGYYTWLEPPLQPKALKCENCGIQCLKVHRCDTCKLKGYCSSMCAAAHMFDHDCYESPKPWLSPPTGPKQPPPTELGEEGLFGFIPWNWVRYGILVLCSYFLYHGLDWFVNFREDRGLSNVDAVAKIYEQLWHGINNYLQDRFMLDQPGSVVDDVAASAAAETKLSGYQKTLEDLASAAGADDSDGVFLDSDASEPFRNEL